MKNDKRENRNKIKPKSNAPTPDIEQERIQEKLSIPIPVAPLPKRAKPFWQRYLGTRVLLRLKNGIEISGILKEILWDWIRLENVLEVGKDHRVSADWIMVEASSVSRFYPGNAHFE